MPPWRSCVRRRRASTSTASIAAPTISPHASAKPPTNGCFRAPVPCRASRCSPTTRTSRSPSPASGTWRGWSVPASTSVAPPRPAHPPSCSATTAPSAGASPRPISTARICSSSGSIRPIPAATSRLTAPAHLRSVTRRSTCCGASPSQCGCARPVTAWSSTTSSPAAAKIRTCPASRPRAMCSPSRRLPSTAPIRRVKDSPASASPRTGTNSWPPPARSSRRCRTSSMPTRPETRG